MEEHSEKFEKVKGYYKKRLWPLSRVVSAVGKWITPAEFEEITGIVYDKK